MGRRGYVLLFILVLLVAGIAGFLGGRMLLQRLQQDFALAPEAEWTPVATDSDLPPTANGPTRVAEAGLDATSVPVDATPTRRPTATVLVVPAAGVTPLSPTAVDTPSVDPFATLAVLPGQEITTTVTVEPSNTPSPAFPFVLARPVRYSNGDCPGTYVLGQVTDRGGQPLPNVRLTLVDEFGNAASAATKAGQADAGRYDFPTGGPPRRFYLTIVDEEGRPLSQRVEILHDMPPHENQPCRWVDWRRR